MIIDLYLSDSSIVQYEFVRKAFVQALHKLTTYSFKFEWLFLALSLTNIRLDYLWVLNGLDLSTLQLNPQPNSFSSSSSIQISFLRRNQGIKGGLYLAKTGSPFVCTPFFLSSDRNSSSFALYRDSDQVPE